MHYVAEGMHSITGKRALNLRAVCTKLSVFTALMTTEELPVMQPLIDILDMQKKHLCLLLKMDVKNKYLLARFEDCTLKGIFVRRSVR